MKIDGKVAIITGAARGIGRAQAEAILAKGGKVCIADIRREEGKKTASELQSKYGQERVTFRHCDVTKESELKGVVSSIKDAFGHIEIVVNTAGVVRESDWEQTLQINLVAVYRGTELAFEFMGRDKGGAGGVVINLASIAGLLPLTAVPSYTAAKHGVVGMTKALGTPEHYAEKGVRVNCICPWFVDTPLIHGDALTDTPFPDIMMKLIKDSEDTYIKPETIARATIELIEDDSRNGSVLEVQQDSKFVYVDYRRLPETTE